MSGTRNEVYRDRRRYHPSFLRAGSPHAAILGIWSALACTAHPVVPCAVYPHFAFQTCEEYKNALLALRDKLKQLITGGGAASCPNNWTVNGSRQEGAKMIRQT